MNEQSKPLLVVNSTKPLTMDQVERLRRQMLPFTEQVGLHLLVVSEDLQVGIHSDLRPLMEQQLAEQAKTNELLLALIQALADGGDDSAEEDEPSTFMSGKPRG
ncbi:hypothetical protein [Pseudomonas tohonis]|uniref:hypothetical protein n=1 Tax=Pseudomonas tohonis TaxID=2725477 RepID=UPI001F2600FE|nr:hypothetical protein [Pseudomonas tohonis]